MNNLQALADVAAMFGYLSIACFILTLMVLGVIHWLSRDIRKNLKTWQSDFAEIDTRLLSMENRLTFYPKAIKKTLADKL